MLVTNLRIIRNTYLKVVSFLFVGGNDSDPDFNLSDIVIVGTASSKNKAKSNCSILLILSLLLFKLTVNNLCIELSNGLHIYANLR